MRTYIKALLILQGFWFLIASFIDSFVEDSKDPSWFHYLSLSLICFGLWAIIVTIEENKPK